MEKYRTSIVGLDVKPRRRVIQKNRYKPSYSRWLIPTLLVLLTMGILIIAGIR